MENQLKTNNNNILILVILGAFVFFIFIMPILDEYNNMQIIDKYSNIKYNKEIEIVKISDNNKVVNKEIEIVKKSDNNNVDNKEIEIVKNSENNRDKTKIYENSCSRECCKFSQWPLPPELTEKKLLNESTDDYIGSNMSCNGGDKGGCLCFSKDNYNYISQRGGNN
jgi:hypothetical protein